MIAPNKKSLIADVIRDHPEIDMFDEESPSGRARILDYAIARLNAQPAPEGAHTVNPWGRKARKRIDVNDPSTGINLNTDALTLLLADGRFEIIDVINGSDGKESWHNYGAFSQGENGYWAPGLPVDDERPKPGPVPRPPSEPQKPVTSKPAHDYSAQLSLSREIGRVLGHGRQSPYRGNPEAIAEVVGHLLWKVQFEGYPVQAAIDNANRRARGEVAD